jgi:hypothetical protein
MVMRKVICGFTSAMAVVMLIGFSVGVVQAGPCELPVFNPDNFDDPQDNVYLPKDSIGYTYQYEAETEDGLIRNYIQFTSETKEIMGVTCTVVYDVEWIYVEDEGRWFKLEETDDWHAWDNYGNFWYFGELTTEIEYDDDWNYITENHEGSWEAGVDDALPGIILLADPRPGVCVQQEYYEDEAEDMGKVLRLNATVSVELGDYEDCLVTKEWTPLEPGNVEHKYYAPDVGLVFIEELKEKTVEVELVDISDVPPPNLNP